MSDPDKPLWPTDPDVVLFITDDDNLPVGAAEQHGLGDAAARVFGRSKVDLKADWVKTIAQMAFLLDGLESSAERYEATEVTFQLAFTAKGGVAFIAEAGITSSVTVTFSRKGDPQQTGAPMLDQ